jgi:hypothetical protein
MQADGVLRVAGTPRHGPAVATLLHLPPCAPLHAARSTYRPTRRAPLDDEYILGIVLQHKRHLVLAAVTVVLCTASNLAAPVLSGMLFEHLVQQHSGEAYAQV